MIDENTKAFFTLAWGFDPYEFPAWGFSTRGAANSFISKYTAGDWLIVVATGGEPTAERDRGRVLGMLQVSSGSQVHDLDSIIKNLDGPKDPKIFDDDGVFKWRHGFLITKAVRFDEPPIFNELFPGYERNGRQEAATAVPLPGQMLQIIRSLPFSEVALPDSPAIKGAQNFEKNKMESERLRTWSKGEQRSASEHDLSAPHDVYLFLQPNLGVKVGYSNNVERRLAEINAYHRLDEKYFENFLIQTVKNSADAELLELWMKEAFSKTAASVGNECYKIKRADKAQSIWNEVIHRWMQRTSD